MMGELNGLTFRLTDAKDLEAICALSLSAGILPVVDYMCESYLELIKDPLFYAAVGEINGEMVAFESGIIQMDGKKVFCRSSRVKLQWRDRGILRRLKQFFQKTLHDTDFPQLRFEEFGTHDTNPAIQKLYDNPEYKQIYEYPYQTYTLGDCDLSANDSNNTVSEIGMEGLQRILQDGRLCTTFFPVRIFVGLINFEPVISELKLIAHCNPYILASEKNSDIRLVSVGAKASSILYAVFWTSTLPPSSDELLSSLKGHLTFHFRRMSQLGVKGQCYVSFKRGYDDVVAIAAKELNLTTVQSHASIFLGFRKKCQFD